MRTSRLVAFSDGVFAIAATLLMLELRVPSDEDVRVVVRVRRVHHIRGALYTVRPRDAELHSPVGPGGAHYVLDSLSAHRRDVTERTTSVARIVDVYEMPASAPRRWPAAATVVTILMVFAVTLAPVQRAGRIVLGLAGFGPLDVTMTGIVTDESGSPVPEAFVRVDQSQQLATTITDGGGRYRIGFTLEASKPADVSIGANGYEATLRALRVRSTDPRYDARLRPVVSVDAGTTTHLVVAPEDGLCYTVGAAAAQPTLSLPCRVIHVIGLQVGVLTVTVVPDDPRDQLGVTFGVGSQPWLILATPCCAQEASDRVTGGGEAVLQVLALDFEDGSPPATAKSHQGFTLKTAFVR